MNSLPLAGWTSRFWAWLIDVLLIGILWGIFRGAFAAPALSLDVHGIGFNFEAQGLMAFIYWTFLEGYSGQSLGKMVMNLAVTGPEGEKIGFGDAAIESFGKAFLLPLDCLVGWLAMRGQGQRMFNRISNTFVIRAGIECELCEK